MIRIAAKITVYHINIKTNLATNHYYKHLWSRESFEESTISDLESSSNFQVKEFFFIKIGLETWKLDFCGPDSHLGKVQYRIWNPHQISKS